MYKVSTYNLSADCRHAQSDWGSNDLGTLTSEQFFAVLNSFCALDAVENNDADPRIDVSVPLGRFNIHTTSGKLLITDTSDPTRTPKELPALEIINFLSGPVSVPSTSDSPASPQHLSVPHSPGRKGLNQSIAFAMLIVGLALNGYTLYSAFYIEDINTAPPLVLLTEKSEVRKQTEVLQGTFITGTDIGDRSIVVGSDGSLKLQEFASKGAIRTQTNHPFNLGKRDNKLFLALKPRGQIEVSNRDTLLFYGDSYRRVK